MARAKIKFPLDSICGTICGPDRTIGRDVGMASSIRQRVNASAGTDRPDLKVQLYATTAPTRGGSVERHERSTVYCHADTGWKLVSPCKRANLPRWYKYNRQDQSLTMDAYHIYMKYELKGALEMPMYLKYGYYTRFLITNTDDQWWFNQKVVLLGIPVFSAAGTDMQVFSLLRAGYKVGRISYWAKMIESELVFEVDIRGQAIVTIPELQDQTSMFVDVYSYCKI
jgi:hypothetical protein